MFLCIASRKNNLFSLNPSGDRRIESQDKMLEIQQLQRISHYFKTQDFENVSINTKLIQTPHKLFLTAGALLKENC